MIRVHVPPLLWALGAGLARRMKLPLEVDGLQLVLQTLDEAIRVKDLKLPGFLAAELTRLELDIDAKRLSEIDVSKLHANPKRRSGYEGVHTSGARFVAHVPNANGIGLRALDNLFETAEEAAWERRKHFLAAGLPYGRFAAAIAHTRKMFPAYAPELAYRVTIFDAAADGRPFDDLSPEDRQWEQFSPFLYNDPSEFPRSKYAAMTDEERAQFKADNDARIVEAQRKYQAHHNPKSAAEESWDAAEHGDIVDKFD